MYRSYFNDLEWQWTIRGHVEDDADAIAIVRAFEEDPHLQLGAVSRGYERVVPRGGWDGEPGAVICHGPARGAYAVTTVEVPRG